MKLPPGLGGYFRGMKESQALDGRRSPRAPSTNCIAPWAASAYLRAMAEEKRLVNLSETFEKESQEVDLEGLAIGCIEITDKETGESPHVQDSKRRVEASCLPRN